MRTIFLRTWISKFRLRRIKDLLVSTQDPKVPTTVRFSPEDLILKYWRHWHDAKMLQKFCGGSARNGQGQLQYHMHVNSSLLAVAKMLS